MTAQRERLQQDVVELEQYLSKLKRRGKNELIPKIHKKIELLKHHIAEKQLVTT